jgi:hypothetical protein
MLPSPARAVTSDACNTARANALQAAGMYIVGEVEMTNVSWVASYQREGALPATLSYPAFFTLRNVFAYGNSMYQ